MGWYVTRRQAPEAVDPAPSVPGALPAGAAAPVRGWRAYVNALIARELTPCVRDYDHLVQWRPRPDDRGLLRDAIRVAEKSVIPEDGPAPRLADEVDRRTAVLLNGNLNHCYDILSLLKELKAGLSRTSRALLVLYNPYLGWLYRLANRLGIRRGEVPSNFLTRTDLADLAKLAGFEVVQARTAGYVPWRLLGLATPVNRLLAVLPGVRWLALTYLVVLRPVIPETRRPSLSVVIPARNEAGNVEAAVRRMPDLGCPLEILFVEGHSTDDTWEEIRRVVDAYRGPFTLRALRQTGKGKGDAVRLGFTEAAGELLAIVDADLTMPPELLSQFYDAYLQGHGDFINGSRLVYPMEGEAMRFLNRLGNVFFAKALSWVLDARLGDSLCGTKLLARHDYARMRAWRERFGDFDPFGDFELLFPAGVMALGIVDVPIRYRARTYGSTNIHRFRHGLALLRMTWIGLRRIKLGR